MKIAIIVPMAIEAEYYRKHFHSGRKEMFGSTEFEHFSVNSNDIYLGLSGIGKVQAAMNLSSLLTEVEIDQIFMTGTAGSLNKGVKKGDLLLVSSFAYHDAHNTLAGNYVEGQIPGEPAEFKLDSKERNEFAKYLTAEKVAYKEGLVVTGDAFVGSDTQKAVITANFPSALAVEMEGAAFAQVAKHFAKPLVALRAISDNGDDNANEDFDQFAKKVGARAASLICAYLEKMS
ncbi:5'-methylthioadenosine/adenosylhomocysteine nucleosidase [Lactobacillus sp. ESL0791]|uniref:5'-methylthioadenosine/adenosylhomocysteine nucleosidase n=1 Tax=Lactobacillus sp. ESL0791 TaxID=2983234 RepID=UPI0023F74371|nr:5'-methylthioadenosine/adenosylhomocysteine nucleosidase [Lactobacillus sp. ESL0791]MDF7638820.1 5'-methylthioadenosine/adenosylhomocysteine nucleosidase [Lactobacillus sp. ESL0791]